MALSRLFLNNIRCIESTEIFPCSGFNFFYGENGAGKTTLLEAINILSTGRSFRTPHVSNVIRHDQSSLTVAGTQLLEQKEQQLGIKRSRDNVVVRINQQPIKQISELSLALPLIEFHPNSTQLLTGGPGQRRSYLDWGVFQTNSSFLSDWRQFQHILKQRNSLLKAKKPTKEIILWDKQLVSAADKIHQARKQYLINLQSHLPKILNKLEIDYQLDFQYKPGWKQGETFEQALEKNTSRDQSFGYTRVGPHRADLSISLNNYPVAASASRGQLKFVTILLKLLQATHYKKSTHKNAILLLDDLPSEFDQKYLTLVIQLIKNLKTQVFITTVESNIEVFKREQKKMFHVEQGMIKEG